MDDQQLLDELLRGAEKLGVKDDVETHMSTVIFLPSSRRTQTPELCVCELSFQHQDLPFEAVMPNP